MPKLVVLGLEGDTALWLVDLDNKTVTLQGTRTGAGDAASAAVAARANGFTTIKGVDFAVAADSQSDAASYQMITGP